MYKNAKKDKIISAVGSFYPNMNFNDKNASFNGSHVFQSGMYPDLRVRKPTTGEKYFLISTLNNHKFFVVVRIIMVA